MIERRKSKRIKQKQKEQKKEFNDLESSNTIRVDFNTITKCFSERKQ
jgi:hypothetical protein